MFATLFMFSTTTVEESGTKVHTTKAARGFISASTKEEEDKGTPEGKMRGGKIPYYSELSRNGGGLLYVARMMNVFVPRLL